MSRALRFGVGWPLSYWGNYVMAIAYIIKRLPSSLFKNKTPYEIMFKKSPNYYNLKSFGCLAMAYNIDRKKDKFKARAIPCVFLRYPTIQKGCKLENIVTKQ